MAPIVLIPDVPAPPDVRTRTVAITLTGPSVPVDFYWPAGRTNPIPTPIPIAISTGNTLRGDTETEIRPDGGGGEKEGCTSRSDSTTMEAL